MKLKAIGAIRKIDRSGRMGIPVDYMKAMGWIKDKKDLEGDGFSVEVLATEEGHLIIRPYPRQGEKESA